MTKPRPWLDADGLAGALGISRRGATKVLTRAHAGHPWRGHQLEVRTVHGRGGRAGLAYEVSLSSLSEALPEAAAPPLPVLREPRIGANNTAAMARRQAAILPIVAHADGTPERVAALAAAVKAGVGAERSLRRWAKDYDAEGLAGVDNRRPVTAGQARIVVSRAFDRAFLAAGYTDAQLARVGEAVDPAVKGLWIGPGGNAGWQAVARDAGFLVWEACETQGCPMPLRAAVLTRRTVERWRHLTIVNQRRNDRKAYDDAKPRIRRSHAHRLPMEEIVADVKPLDIIVMRPDGTTAWPRAVGFHDSGTGRLFLHLVLCAKGEGVRQEHIIEAFLAMVADAEWGFPRTLYFDNGSEMAALSKMKPCLELINEPGARTIIKAKPYNASAKPVESAFARLDRLVTCVFPGYAGRDRMTKKTQTVGRPPKPYPHDFERFTVEYLAAVADLNATPFLSGERKGRSAAEIFAQRCADGWAPVTVDPLALDAAFCDRTEAMIRGGAVSIKGVRYLHPQLVGSGRRKVQVALPWRRDRRPLFNTGAGWAYLAADDMFPSHWTEGAQESGRRQRAQDRAVARLGAGVRELDVTDLRSRRAALQAAPKIVRAAGALDLGQEPTTLGAATEAATLELLDEVSEAERLRRVRERETARLLRSMPHVA